MGKLSKVLSLVVIAIMLLSCMTVVYGADADDPADKPTTAVSMDPSEWGEDTITANDKIKTDQVKGITKSIINVVASVGSGVAIIALIVLGMKYMMGSAEEKAEYKKTLLPYFLGAIMVFGASALTGIIYSMIN